MKVTLDLERLLAQGSIDAGEYAKLSALSARGTGALAFNILVAFGVIAVSGATLALLPATTTAIALGIVICAAGLVLAALRLEAWRLAANICIVVGALLFSGAIVVLGDGSMTAFLTVSALLACAAVLARSALLAALATLALASCLGARTGYLHAAYFLGIQEPTLTIAVFAAFGALVYALSKRLPAAYRGIAIAAVGTSVFLVNFGFWIGSLWGDGTGRRGAIPRGLGNASHFAIADWMFALAWAVALVGAGIWAWRRDRRWLVNVVAVFGAIHFYTQWFERLGASPATVLTGGLVALAIALVLRAYNARMAAARVDPVA